MVDLLRKSSWNVILKVESTNPLRYDIIKEKKKEVKKNVDLQ